VPVVIFKKVKYLLVSRSAKVSKITKTNYETSSTSIRIPNSYYAVTLIVFVGPGKKELLIQS